MVGQARLFALPADVITIVLSREPGGWRLATRLCPAGGKLLEIEPDVYEQLTLDEAVDVLGATLDGVEP